MFTREDIRDFADPSRVYMTRWHLLRTPWFGIYLHCIRLPDADRHLHDHPWSFFSIVLRGGYLEERYAYDQWVYGYKVLTVTTRKWLSMAFRKATSLHRITTLLKSPTWTLVFVGKKQRSWGFETDRGWIGWKEYFGIQ